MQLVAMSKLIVLVKATAFPCPFGVGNYRLFIPHRFGAKRIALTPLPSALSGVGRFSPLAASGLVLLTRWHFLHASPVASCLSRAGLKDKSATLTCIAVHG